MVCVYPHKEIPYTRARAHAQSITKNVPKEIFKNVKRGLAFGFHLGHT
jgi:hypothetical protein